MIYEINELYHKYMFVFEIYTKKKNPKSQILNFVPEVFLQLVISCIDFGKVILFIQIGI